MGCLFCVGAYYRDFTICAFCIGHLHVSGTTVHWRSECILTGERNLDGQMFYLCVMCTSQFAKLVYLRTQQMNSCLVPSLSVKLVCYGIPLR